METKNLVEIDAQINDFLMVWRAFFLIFFLFAPFLFVFAWLRKNFLLQNPKKCAKTCKVLGGGIFLEKIMNNAAHVRTHTSGIISLLIIHY